MLLLKVNIETFVVIYKLVCQQRSHQINCRCLKFNLRVNNLFFVCIHLKTQVHILYHEQTHKAKYKILSFVCDTPEPLIQCKVQYTFSPFIPSTKIGISEFPV